MKYFLKCCLMLSLTLLLSSCVSDFYNLYLVSDEKQSQDTINKIVKEINNENEATFTALFADNVIIKESDFDDKVRELFEFIEGNIIDYSSSAGIHVSKSSDHGKISKYVKSRFSIETNEAKYHVAVTICVVDTVDQNNVGIHAFDIINDEDWENDYVYGGITEKDHVGINIENTDYGSES